MPWVLGGRAKLPCAQPWTPLVKDIHILSKLHPFLNGRPNTWPDWGPAGLWCSSEKRGSKGKSTNPTGWQLRGCGAEWDPDKLVVSLLGMPLSSWGSRQWLWCEWLWL